MDRRVPYYASPFFAIVQCLSCLLAIAQSCLTLTLRFIKQHKIPSYSCLFLRAIKNDFIKPPIFWRGQQLTIFILC